MVETRAYNEEYAAAGRRLIESEDALADIAASGVRIAYLSSDAKRLSHGKKVLGQCEKVPVKYRWACPYDFTITLFEPNIEGFGAGKIEALLFHELLHVGVAVDDDGAEHYSIVGHDYEEFREIIDRFGMEWWR